MSKQGVSILSWFMRLAGPLLACAIVLAAARADARELHWKSLDVTAELALSSGAESRPDSSRNSSSRLVDTTRDVGRR